MITQPTTDALVLDCCRELSEEILPAIQDDTVKLRLIMTVTVLGNAAVRAANEIAWMRQETEGLLDFVNDVAAAHPDDADNGIPAALDAVESTPRESLLLRDVVDVYEAAGRAFDAALRVAQRAEAAEFIDRAAALLRARVDTEKQVMADYAIVGR
jgi:hypothetical protein